MINCALIGKGYWGAKLEKYLRGNSHLTLMMSCDSKSNLHDIWDNPGIQAVVIATPNETHYSLVKSALLSGKHVFAEKPLALKTAECLELKNLASEKGRVLLVEYTYTFSKALLFAKKLVNDGDIGRILGMEMAVRHLGRFKGGSVYWLLASHMLSVLDMFVPLKELNYSRKDLVMHEGEAETGVILFDKAGLSGQIVVSLNYPEKETKVIIYGEKGSIIYNPLVPASLVVEKYERLKWTIASKLPRERREFEIDESENLRYAVEYFAHAVEGRENGNTERAVEITRILENLHR